MESIELENKLAKTYLDFIGKLRPEVQLDLIAKISLSLKKQKKIEKKPKISPESYFSGIWKSDKTAEEIIAEIKNTSPSTREIIAF